MALLNVAFQRIKARFMPIPLPPQGTFKGCSVLVTGGTAGLGFEAALHFARLGADLIITCRSKSRGDEAKQKIQRAAPQSDVRVMELDMARYSSCISFVAELRKVEGKSSIDVVVLNAGMLTPHFVLSPEGWETTVQVNALNTALLGMLLLDMMKSERANRSSQAHIVFVTSRDHLYPDIRCWKEWSENEGLLHRFSDRKHWPAPWKLQSPNYAESKLLLTYAVEEISRRALLPNSEPEVIVNSVCPGMVRTSIGQTVANQGWFMRTLVAVYMGFLGKPPSYGARYYVNAALSPKEEHGRFSMTGLTYEQYLKKAKTNIYSDHARKVQALAWKEIIGELSAKVPELGSHWTESL